MSRPPAQETQKAPGSWLAVCVGLSVAVLAWFGYAAIREWQRTSLLLADRRAKEGVDLLVTALTRDMEGVQHSVLSSGDWNEFMLDPPYDVINLVARAFSRYPYPESFFAWHDVQPAAPTVFFHRRDRLPTWTAPESGPNRFPVVVDYHAPFAQPVLDRIHVAAREGRRFAVFETELGGSRYQVVARLLYRNGLPQDLAAVFGFTVNLPWARHYYFPDLAQQIGRLDDATAGIALAIVDGHGEPVARWTAAQSLGRVNRRSFPVLFFDPSLVTTNPPGDLSRDLWFVQAAASDDPTLG